MNSLHEDYEMGGPGGPGAGPGAPGGPNNWPRTPASPVFNSHVGGSDPYRSKKPDSLGKLYDMDDSKERWMWLDKLLQFMEERGSPIQACPTISKNPLDLFRLYFYVKERGGFMEVTKNKTWKDIAGLLGIGASSSAAYTLRKHYTKNLLPYECHFDRGGIDPQPIINQVEAGTKKKSAKAAPVPSPGSSNSQDSFPPPGSGSTSMDGYGSYGYPPNAGPEYNAQRPPSQSNASSPHPGVGVPNHGAGDNISVSNPFDDGAPGQGPGQRSNSYGQPFGPSGPPRSGPQGYQGQGGYQYPEQYNRGPEYNQQYPPGGNFPSNRPMYPPYGPEGDRPPYNQSPSSGQGGPPGTPGSDPYNRYQPPGYQPRPGYPPAPPSSPGTPQPPGQAGEYYRPDQQPRRHPDFAKDQQPYQPFNQQRPAMYGGWPNNTQYRGQYPPQAGTQPNSQQWNQPPRPGAPPNSQASSGQWPQSPYQPPQNSQQPWGPNMPPSGVGQGSPLRPPLGPHAQYRPDGKPRPPMPGGPPPGMKMPQPSQSPGTMGRMKSDSAFPLDSVEATTPVLYKRKRLMRADVCPVEAWRLMMSLRSGLLAESCWALDTLNILLFDDVSVAYFGLQHMPGLLDVLLEHFRKALDDMFESSPTGVIADRKWYEKSSVKDQDVDLGSVMEPIDPNDKTQILSSTMPNYTLVTRKGKPVRIVNRDSDVFILDTKKTWDVEGEASDSMVESEAAVEALATKYIVPCFQAEFHAVPFVRLIPDKKSTGQSRPHSPKTEPQDSDCSDSAPACKEEVQLSITEGCVSENTIEKKNCEKKKRTKSLSDVLNRIKKEKEELLSATKQDALSRDLSASVNEQGGIQVKKENLGVGKANNNRSENSNALSKDSNMVIEENHVSESSKADDGESENKSDNSVPVTEVKLEPMEVDEPAKTASEKVASSEAVAVVPTSRPYIRIGDPESVVKRRRMSDYEDECYTRDEASLYLVTDTQDSIARRCVCLSNILRNLSFIPGNEMEFAKNPTFLGLLGKLMLIHHEHPLRTQRNYEREEDADCTDSCSSLSGDAEWWWDFLFQLRENVLVTMSNIAGQVDLGQYPEEVSRPLLDGLLHWAVCPAAHGQDPFPTVGPNSSLSPQRLALEALCKLCVMEANVDLVIATPPYSRLERLCAVLTKLLCRSEEQVLREFAVNLLHYLAAADSGMARTVALQGACVSQLVAFIEQAEQVALGVANQHGISALRDNPDAMGTSLDMLRRAAGTLLHLARHPDNRPLFLQQEQRLLALVMSQILDQQVAAVVSSVLFQCSRTPGPARPHPISANTTVAATAPS